MKKAMMFAGAAALGAAAMGRRTTQEEADGRHQASSDAFGGGSPGLPEVRYQLNEIETGISPFSSEFAKGYKHEAERMIAAAGGKRHLSVADYRAWSAKKGSSARGRRAGPRGYEVDDWGEEYVSSGFVGPLPRGDRRWKSSWDDDFRAGFAAGTKAKKIIPASTAYNRGKISKCHGSEWMVGYSAAIGVKRGLYATRPVRRAEALGLINQGRRAEKKPAIWGYINWTEGRAHPTRYSMPVYSAKQAYRTEDAFADRHPSKKRVSISRKKPRNARPVPQHDA